MCVVTVGVGSEVVCSVQLPSTGLGRILGDPSENGPKDRSRWRLVLSDDPVPTQARPEPPVKNKKTLSDLTSPALVSKDVGVVVFRENSGLTTNPVRPKTSVSGPTHTHRPRRVGHDPDWVWRVVEIHCHK